MTGTKPKTKVNKQPVSCETQLAAQLYEHLVYDDPVNLVSAL